MIDLKEYVEEYGRLADYHNEAVMAALQGIEIAKDNARKELDAYRRAFDAWRAKRPQVEVSQ